MNFEDKVEEFLRDRLGTYVGWSESPALIRDYYMYLTGSDMGSVFSARNLWFGSTLDTEFDRVGNAEFGDIVVLDNKTDYGTVGICSAHINRPEGSLRIFTQNPGPVWLYTLQDTDRVLGIFRYKGKEKTMTKFAVDDRVLVCGEGHRFEWDGKEGVVLALPKDGYNRYVVKVGNERLFLLAEDMVTISPDMRLVLDSWYANLKDLDENLQSNAKEIERLRAENTAKLSEKRVINESIYQLAKVLVSYGKEVE